MTLVETSAYGSLGIPATGKPSSPSSKYHFQSKNPYKKEEDDSLLQQNSPQQIYLNDNKPVSSNNDRAQYVFSYDAANLSPFQITDAIKSEKTSSSDNNK